MSDTYLVRLLGILPGFTLDNVIAKLSNLFGKSPEAIRGLLASSGATIKRGVDSATASRYQTALEQCGCQCLLEAERRWTNIPAADFAAMSLQRFVGARLGVVVNAPASWRDASDEQYFQLVDPQTGTQLTAGGYENPGMTLEQWAEARLGTVAEAMPYLSVIKPPYRTQGANWTAVACEFVGRFPKRDEASRYLVLCLHSESMLLSLTLAVPCQAFEQHEAFFRWLLASQVELYQVKTITNDAAGLARLRALAEQGNADAQFALAQLCETGQALPKDEQLAAAWYRKAAEQGHAGAQFNLGVLCATGRGTAKQPPQAIAWWRRAAEQGHVNAQVNLGVMFATGQGVPQDHHQACAWYRKASEQGSAAGQFSLAVCYIQGNGVPQDYSLAAEWARKAAEQGHADAQFYLAIMYENGDGVPQDFHQAGHWLAEAAEQGHELARSRLASQ